MLGGKDTNRGGVPVLGVLARSMELPRLYCSQQYVSVSPSASLPAAVSLKGVPMGKKVAGVCCPFTVGGVLPVGEVAAQLPPVPCKKVSMVW